MTIDLEQVLTAVSVILGIAAIGTLARRWIKNQFESMNRELQTGNGRTIGVYMCDVHKKVEEIAGIGRDNRTLITETQRRVERVERDQIEHEVKGH